MREGHARRAAPPRAERDATRAARGSHMSSAILKGDPCTCASPTRTTTCAAAAGHLLHPRLGPPSLPY